MNKVNPVETIKKDSRLENERAVNSVKESTRRAVNRER